MYFPISFSPVGRACPSVFSCAREYCGHVFVSSLLCLVCCGVLYCCEGQLLRKSEVGGDVEDGEYLGAAMRLTAELSRYAITQVCMTYKTGEEKQCYLLLSRETERVCV